MFPLKCIIEGLTDHDDRADHGELKVSKTRGEGEHWNRSGSSSIKDKTAFKCYLCEGPHRVRDCPNRSKMMTIIMDDDPESNETLRIGVLHVLSSVQTEQACKTMGLVYNNVQVNGQKLRAMLDTGAMENIMS